MKSSHKATVALLFLLVLSLTLPQFSVAGPGGRGLPPTVTSDLKNPSHYSLGTTIQITGTASDDDEILTLEVLTSVGQSWNNITTGYNNGTGTYSWPWVTTSETAGTHQVTVRARDRENKYGQAQISIILDGNDPVVSIKLPATNGNSATVGLGDTIVISGDASDATTSLTGLNISTDAGTNWVDLLPSIKAKAWTYNWVTKPTDAPKRHEVMVQAGDLVGHTVLVSINLTLSDLKPPQVAITVPDDNKELTAWNSVDIKGTASDNIGVTTLEISAFAKGMVPKKTNITGKLNAGSWSWTWDSKTLLAGKYSIQVWAKDKKGSQVTDVINLTFSDKTGPTVNITLPATGTSFNHGDSVAIVGKATDNIRLAKVELVVDALPPVNITKDVGAGGSFTHMVTDLKDGPHTVKVKATDMSGNQNEAQIVVKIKAKQAAVPAAAIGAGVVVVVVVLILFLFIAMRKGWIGSKKQSVPGTESVAKPPPPPMTAGPPTAPGPYPPTQLQYQQVPAYVPAQTYQQPQSYQPQMEPQPAPYVPPEPPKLELEPPTIAPIPIDVDEEEKTPPQAPSFPKEEARPQPKPEKPPDIITPPIPGPPPKKPGFQRPALAKSPQQAPAQCPACGLDVDYETLMCQECGARLF